MKKVLVFDGKNQLLGRVFYKKHYYVFFFLVPQIYTLSYTLVSRKSKTSLMFFLKNYLNLA